MNSIKSKLNNNDQSDCSRDHLDNKQGGQVFKAKTSSLTETEEKLNYSTSTNSLRTNTKDKLKKHTFRQ